MRNVPDCVYSLPIYEFHTYSRWERYLIRRDINKLLDPILGRNRTLMVILPIIVAILLGAFLTCCWYTDAFAEDDILYVSVHKGSYLNGRAEPNKHSEVTMKLYYGDTVEFVGRSGEWIEIRGGETGTSFVDSRYVSETINSFTATNVSGGRVRVRSSIEGRSVGYVKAGQTVTVERTISGWGYIGSGWIKLEYFDY